MTGELEIAREFAVALAEAARTGNRELVYPFLASDVEWVTPKRTLHGIDEIREQLTWISAPEHLDLEFEVGDWVELDEGRVVAEVHQVYRLKGSGEIAYERDRRIELIVREGKVGRYEMRIVG
jgi:SnoaL-like domain